MLQLITGLAGTGKTTHLLCEMQRRAKAKKQSILLVPEQFSSSSEAAVWQHLGEVDSGFVEVLSFRTLAQRILKNCGGLGTPVLEDAGRVVYVRRALNAIGQNLKTFARQRQSAAFCTLCAKTLAELKTAGATPQNLLQVANHLQDDKFKELALIFAAYEAQIAGCAMDPQNLLELAAQKANCGYFDEKTCFVDSFDGFTAPEYSLILQLMHHCTDFCAALCCTAIGKKNADTGLFAPVHRTAQRLLNMAQTAGQSIAPHMVLQTLHRPKKAALAGINLVLAGQPAAKTPPDGIFFTPAQDEWEEVRLAAAQMYQLALQGVPYSRMALICRSTENYAQAVESQLALYNIPFFFDEPGTVEYTAPVSFLRAALGVLQKGLSCAAILALIKTGLCGCDENEAAAFENYVYTWQPTAAQLRTAFAKHPGGHLQKMDDEANKQLQGAENIRALFVAKLDDFRKKAKGQNAKEISKSLYLLLESFDAPAHLEEMALQLLSLAEFALADQCRRAWDVAITLLEQMETLLGEDILSPAEYDEFFLILVRGTDFGQVPQTLECAVFTGADRMRLSAPDYCFILGIWQGEFPKEVGYSGILSHSDRDALVRQGVEMPGSFENRCMLEEMFFYKALCAPAKGLYLSYPRSHMGQGRTQSAALVPVLENFEPPKLEPSQKMLAATPAAAFDLLGMEYRNSSTFAASLSAALKDSKAMQSQMDILQNVDNPGQFFVKDLDIVKKILGSKMTISATTAEQFYKCPFSYFMQRILRVYPRRKAEVSALESGTLVHYILEKVLLEKGPGFAQCTDEELLKSASRHAQKFIEDFLPDESLRTARRLAQIKDNCARLVLFMRDAAAQSQFTTASLELAIADEAGAVPPLEIKTQNGEMVRVVGKIDRLDTLAKDGKTFLCIVDYKTGNKDFKPEELAYGNNIQMMVYMAALCENSKDMYPGAAPAGVLYLGSDPSPQMGPRGGKKKPGFKINGLFLSDTSILDALDNREKGGYLPVGYNKDGSPKKQSPVADAAAFNQNLNTVKSLLADMASAVYAGNFPAKPLVKGQVRPCTYCAYRGACRHEDGKNETEMNAAE